VRIAHLEVPGTLLACSLAIVNGRTKIGASRRQGPEITRPVAAARCLAVAVVAVVFDMDGVLVDSEPLWDEVRRGLAAEFDRPWPVGATRAMQGMSTREWSGYLAADVGVPGSASSLADLVIARLAGLYALHLPLLPGAVSAVSRLAAKWPLGLASSSPRALIDSVLAATGLTSAFVATLSTEEVAAGKPSPDVYLRAVAALGTPAGRTVAIEDSTNGIRAAVAAGLPVVAVPQPSFPPSADSLALASAIVSDLDGVTVGLVAGLA
jgi:HAD superfamily hydrolase (TIGR01509 family)